MVSRMETVAYGFAVSKDYPSMETVAYGFAVSEDYPSKKK
jgi:hypothetical protein